MSTNASSPEEPESHALEGLGDWLKKDPTALAKVSDALAHDPQSVEDLRKSIEEFQAAEAEEVKHVVPPDFATLRVLAVGVGVPMIGFGFVDNALMILAGDAIDQSIGLWLGISTLAAAGLGNLVSDLGGLGLQGVMEQKLKMPMPRLSRAQWHLPRTRLAEKLGAAIGISVGCLLGMFPLLFLHHDKHGKTSSAHSKARAYCDVIGSKAEFLGATTATLYIVGHNSEGQRLAFTVCPDSSVATTKFGSQIAPGSTNLKHLKDSSVSMRSPSSAAAEAKVAAAVDETLSLGRTAEVSTRHGGMLQRAVHSNSSVPLMVTAKALSSTVGSGADATATTAESEEDYAGMGSEGGSESGTETRPEERSEGTVESVSGASDRSSAKPVVGNGEPDKPGACFLAESLSESAEAASAALYVPVVDRDGAVIGVLELLRDDGEPFPDSTLRRAQGVAGLLSHTLQSWRAGESDEDGASDGDTEEGSHPAKRLRNLLEAYQQNVPEDLAVAHVGFD